MNKKKKYYLYSKNQFYSEYLIDENIYRILGKITEGQLTVKDIKEYIDLIYKSIIKISFKKQQHNFHEGKDVNAALYNSINSEKCRDIHIVEFQTKTTPTCLTSYLRQ
jgi:carbamoyltransferase